MYSLAVACAAAGMLCIRYATSKDSPEGEAVIVKYGHKYRLDEYFWLLEYGVKAYGIKEYHRRMGRLYGYSEEDIEAFIAAEINCNCTKCRGV